MKTNGTVFVISAPSGCGKTTIVDKLLKTVKNLKRSISITTRAPRQGETQSRDYFFISEKAFKKKVEKGSFLEWAKNFGYYYGTPKKNVHSLIKAGHDVVLTIDVKGATQVRKKMPDSVLVFIAPPNLDDLYGRLKKRATDSTKEVSNRLAIAKKEMIYSKKYDYIVINDKLRDAVECVKSIIMSKRCEVNKHRKT